MLGGTVSHYELENRIEGAVISVSLFVAATSPCYAKAERGWEINFLYENVPGLKVSGALY